jgi:hypothetical protein
MTRWADLFCPRQAPLRVVLKPGLSFGRLVIAQRVAIAGLAQPRMGSNEFVPMEQLHNGVGGLEPQILANQRERHRPRRQNSCRL